MKSLLIILILIIVAIVLLKLAIGFHTQRPSHYAGTGPAFDLRKHLSGPMKSEGMIYGPRGRVSSRFVADMNGTWEGETGTLTEDFVYAGSGQEQARRWSLMIGENGKFTATAPDVIGTAHGEVSGATVRLTYRIKLLEDAGGHVLDVTDWMYLMENGVIMNRSEMRKYGVKVAELIATIRPVSP
ncbi:MULTISPECIES: DUF3833 domain-containing protein [Shimia]|uniref:DUF3833 domain-containing protein n=1 Tax=Shimia TaxID=573139 RepID=UPI001FB3D085|nr:MULTISPECIES: DUF3833 domain-containing protein [Shimia]MDV4146689.1 DUF3833 domain-containing protein [Shimia sp. FJ5]